MSHSVSTYGMMPFQLDTFDKVVSEYNNTKPIISRYHTIKDDIRPIRDRNRKYERIMKFSQTCYALLDGGEGDNKCFPQYLGDKDKIHSNEVTFAFAPIVWTRHKDHDTIRIRNGSGEYAHNSRYSFLGRAVPNSMYVSISNGKQYVGVRENKYLLPKSEYHQRVERIEEYVGHRYLTFKVAHGSMANLFELIGHKYIFHNKKFAVDKETKSKYKTQLDNFWEHLCATAPLFNTTFGRGSDWQVSSNVMHDAHEEVQEYCKKFEEELRAKGFIKQGIYNPYQRREGWFHNYYPVACLDEILNDDEHTLRLNLIKEVLYDIPKLTECSTKEDAQKCRAKFNSWFNTHMGWLKEVSAEYVTEEKV